MFGLSWESYAASDLLPVLPVLPHELIEMLVTKLACSQSEFQKQKNNL